MSPSPDNTDVPVDEKTRILVVDDEPTLRLGFAYALSNRGTEVETAANGRLALDRLADSRFDIVILDLRMPELDGIGVIEALRATGNRTPVILCSAALTPNAALRAIRHGVIDFLLKPVRPVDLRQAVESVLRPDHLPLALAMKAARKGSADEAIQILESDGSRDERSTCWLTVLKAIQTAGVPDDPTRLEEMVRTNLTVLAFNPPSAR